MPKSELKLGFSSLTNTVYAGKVSKGMWTSKCDITKDFIDTFMRCAMTNEELRFVDDDIECTMKFSNPERGVFNATFYTKRLVKEEPNAESK